MLRDDLIVRDLRTGELYAVIERERSAVLARNIVSDEIRVLHEDQVITHSPGLLFVGEAVQAVIFADYARIRSLYPIIVPGTGGAIAATAFGWTQELRGWMLLWLYIAGGLFGVLVGAGWSALRAALSSR